MRNPTVKIALIGLMVFAGILFTSCCPICEKGDNACWKAWYNLEPNPTDPNRYTTPWERFSNPELRQPDDAGSEFWDWIFGIKK